MRRKLSEIKKLSIFRITEKPEELTDSKDNDPVLESIESLKSEIAKLGKAQIQTRMFVKTEYQSLRESVDALSSNNHVVEAVIEDLLSIADGLEAGTRAGGEILSPDMASWIQGLIIVQQRTLELLKKLDVYPIHSVGMPFDPSLHNAVAVEHDQSSENNIILEEQRRGYMRDGKIMRYAEVIVNKYPVDNKQQLENYNE